MVVPWYCSVNIDITVPGNSWSDWFVEHRIATWGLSARQDNGSNQWLVVTKWHPLGEQWNPAGGISGTCVHLLCATQCLTDGRMFSH